MKEANVDTVRLLAIKWGEDQPSRPSCPPEARFITGKPDIDALIYYFEYESGLLLKLSADHEDITGYDVVDPEKFTWFMLKWL